MTKTERIGFEQVDALFKGDAPGVTARPFMAEGFMIVSGKQRLPDILHRDTPYIIEDTRLLLVVSGEADIEVNLQKKHVVAGTLIIVNPGAIVKMHSINDEYEVRGMMMSPTLLSAVLDEHIPRCVGAATDFALLQPDADDMLMLERMHETVWEMCTRYGFRKRLIYPLIKATVELADYIYNKEEEERAQPTRTDRLYTRFMQLVAQHGAMEHAIDFYASKLCVSNNYLSAVVKQTSGLTAKDWIDKAIITQAKMLLATTDLQNAQIASRLNFPNPSFFNKYFKRLTGLTPQEYKMGN